MAIAVSELGIIRDETDLSHIRYPSERGVALAFLSRGLEVQYEPPTFWAFREKDGKVKTVGHQPDFIVRNPRNLTAGEIYVEVTESSFNPTQDDPNDDPKEKQKYVMEQAAPGKRYVVLYQNHLANIQRATGIKILSTSSQPPIEVPAKSTNIVPFPTSSQIPHAETLFTAEKDYKKTPSDSVLEQTIHRLVPKPPPEPKLVG